MASVRDWTGKAVRLLAQTPEIAGHSLATALMLGDATRVRDEIARDPAAAIRKYGKRLLFLHLKDVKSASTKSGYEFAELGQGRIDWNAVLAALHDVHFRGWGVVELDGERAGSNLTPKDSAAMSLNFLRQKLGARA